jgi:hypothetical protein
VPDNGTPFFLSYARARGDAGTQGMAHFSDLYTSRFFFDLCEDLSQLISRTPGADVGFMDTRTYGGVHWREELLHAAGTCQVLVALLSAPYLSSEWCGKEWCAFSRRTSRALSGMDGSLHQGHIIPVRWAPVRFSLPSVVKEEMIFSPSEAPDPELPAEYKANGIYGLLRMGREDSYKIIVWQLAMLISRIYHGRRLRTRKFDIDELCNVFNGAAP